MSEICGIICNCGAHGEPLACGYTELIIGGKTSMDALEFTGYPEVEAAAHWWVGTICGPPQNDSGGDPYFDALKTAFSQKTEPIGPEVRDKLYDYLCVTIAAKVARTEWRTDVPNWGSGMRTIHCDYHPDNALEAAAQKAGIYDLYFRCPIKTIMWINPGEVKVSCGYRAPDEVIYSAR
jgi:hypothetical protein